MDKHSYAISWCQLIYVDSLYKIYLLKIMKYISLFYTAGQNYFYTLFHCDFEEYSKSR